MLAFSRRNHDVDDQREDGSADMCYVESTSRSIAENLNKYKVVVEKSTVPVQTSMWIKRTIGLYKKGNGEFDVASNPEFLREGTAVSDFMHPDRVIIGVETKKAEDVLVKIYEKFKDKKIAVLGLAFKPETDDTRNAPSISLINELQSQEALLRLYDPKAMENMKGIFPEDPPKIVYVDNPYDAVKEANALLLVTEWDEFKSLDLNKVKNMMANPIIIDGRNLFDPDEVRGFGFEYSSVGRK